MTELQKQKKQWLSRMKSAQQKLNALQSCLKQEEYLLQKNQMLKNCDDLNQRIQQLQFQVKQQMTSMLSIHEEIVQRIETISDMELQTILIRRHLNGETMNQIAEAMFYDVRTIQRKYLTALDILNI